MQVPSDSEHLACSERGSARSAASPLSGNQVTGETADRNLEDPLAAEAQGQRKHAAAQARPTEAREAAG